MRLKIKYDKSDLLIYNDDKFLKVFEANLLEAMQLYFRGLKPHPKVLISDFMSKNMWLRRSGNARAGYWDKYLTPYLNQICDDLSPFKTFPNRVILVKGVQVGGTIVGIGWILSILSLYGGPCASYFSRDSLLRRVSRKYYKPIFKDCKALQDLIAEHRQVTGNKEKDSYYMYRSPIGELNLGNAEASVTQKGSPYQYIHLTECSSYTANADGEGHPVPLIEARANTFGENKKIFFESSPTDEDCKITELYNENDCRRFQFYISCTICGEYQVLVQDNARFADPMNPYFQCVACDSKILESHKASFLDLKSKRPPKWIADNHKETTGRTHGYHLPSFYSPLQMLSWKEIASKYSEIKGNINKQKTYTNQFEALNLAGIGKALDSDKFQKRLYDFNCEDEQNGNPLPRGVIALFAGVDVNGNKNTREYWVPVHVIGITREFKTCIISYKIFRGDINKNSFWKEVDEFLAKKYTTQFGVKIGVCLASIDVGHETTVLMSRIKRLNRIVNGKKKACYYLPVIASRSNKESVPMLLKNASNRIRENKDDRVIYGNYELKNFTYGRLLIEDEKEDYFIYINKRVLKDEPDYLKQLVAERKVKSTNKKGYSFYEFTKTHLDRNESFITLCYCYLSFYFWSQTNSIENIYKKIIKIKERKVA